MSGTRRPLDARQLPDALRVMATNTASNYASAARAISDVLARLERAVHVANQGGQANVLNDLKSLEALLAHFATDLARPTRDANSLLNTKVTAVMINMDRQGQQIPVVANVFGLSPDDTQTVENYLADWRECLESVETDFNKAANEVRRIVRTLAKPRG